MILLLKPPFSSGIFQPAMFDDTRGLLFFFEPLEAAVCVRMIPGYHGCRQDRLREFFSGCGDIRHAHLAVERTTGRSRGFGKVVFLDSAVLPWWPIGKNGVETRLRNSMGLLTIHSH